MLNKKFTSIGFIALTCLAACTGVSDEGVELEQTVIASEMMDLGLDPFISADTSQFAHGPGRWAKLAATCDPNPEQTFIDACGRSVLGSAHFSWTNCTIELPEGSPKPEITSSGSLDILSVLLGRCDAGDAVLDRTASIEIVRALQPDLSIRLAGTANAQHLLLDSDKIDLVIDISRDVSKGGSVTASANIAGKISMTIDGDEKRRILSGSLSMHMQHPRGGAHQLMLELSNVVRVEHSECRWPIGGTIRNSRDTNESVLVFGPNCGEATRDGTSVNIEELQPRRWGRPF